MRRKLSFILVGFLVIISLATYFLQASGPHAKKVIFLYIIADLPSKINPNEIEFFQKFFRQILKDLNQKTNICLVNPQKDIMKLGKYNPNDNLPKKFCYRPEKFYYDNRDLELNLFINIEQNPPGFGYVLDFIKNEYYVYSEYSILKSYKTMSQEAYIQTVADTLINWINKY